MSASLARTVFRPTTLASNLSSSTSHCPARHFFPQAARTSEPGRQRDANMLAHLAVLGILLVSTQYYLSHPDALMFDHPPRSAIGWVPSKHIAYRQSVSTLARPPSSASSPPSSASFPSVPSASSQHAMLARSSLSSASPSALLRRITDFENFGRVLAGIGGKE